MKELVKKITEIYSPSGREHAVREFILNEIKDYVDEIKTDKLGNLIAIKKGTSGKTLLFDAHMDEIGLVVTHITETGFLKVDAVGGVNPATLIGARVQFNGNTGIIGLEGETAKERMENSKNLSLDNLYVDMGVNTREEAEKLAPIGTFGTYIAHFEEIGDKWLSKAMDDRIACAALIQSAKEMKNNKNTVIFAFTVQEEVGLVGSSVAAYEYDVDMAIAVDVTLALDTPKAFKRMEMKLGAGPCIKIKDAASISDIDVVNFMKKAAENNNIPYQFEVLIFGGTNAASYQKTKSGIPSSTLSIATRYIHSPNELVSKKDVENSVKLLTAMANTEL